MTSAKEARNEGIAYYNLARAYHALKQNDQAVSAGQRALPLFSAEDAKTRILAAEMYNNLGIYYIALNQPEKALDAYAHADSLYQTSGLQDKLQGVIYMEGALRYDEATAAVKKHDWTTARDTCLQAQHFFEQAKKPMDEADAYHKLNFIYTQMGDATHAAEAGRQEQALRSKK